MAHSSVNRPPIAQPITGGRSLLARLGPESLVLLLGRKEAWTPISWKCVEGIPDFLRGRGWVVICSVDESTADPNTLDGYLKSCLKRATAVGWPRCWRPPGSSRSIVVGRAQWLA